MLVHLPVDVTGLLLFDLNFILILISEYFVFDQVFVIEKHLFEGRLRVAEVSLGRQTIEEYRALIVDFCCAALESDRPPMLESLLRKA